MRKVKTAILTIVSMVIAGALLVGANQKISTAGDSLSDRILMTIVSGSTRF